MKKALGVALPLGFLQALLMSQKGRALGEEDRKSSRTNVGHQVRGIVAGAAVGQSTQNRAQVLQVLIPRFKGRGAHAQSLQPASAQSALR